MQLTVQDVIEAMEEQQRTIKNLEELLQEKIDLALSRGKRIAELEAEISALHRGEGGCTCQGCGKKYAVDYHVSDATWAHIKPKGKPEGSGMLCGQCIVDKIEAELEEVKKERDGGWGLVNCIMKAMGNPDYSDLDFEVENLVAREKRLRAGLESIIDQNQVDVVVSTRTQQGGTVVKEYEAQDGPLATIARGALAEKGT